MQRAKVKHVEAQAAAELRRADAYVAAQAAQAQTSAKLAEHAAAAEKQRTDAYVAAQRAHGTMPGGEAEEVAQRSLARSWLFRGGVLLLGGLWADWIAHESEWAIKMRMGARLRAGCVSNAAEAPRQPLPVEGPPPALDFRPTMVVGPTGCGKSTLLATIARRALDDAVPVALVRMRLPGPEDAAGSLYGQPPGSVHGGLDPAGSRMKATADYVFKQIAFPLRRAVLQTALDRISSLNVHGAMGVELTKTLDARDRLCQALSLLFEVAKEQYHARRAAGVPHEDAAPVLLFDQVQDLIRDDRLAGAGGRFVFNTLAVLLVAYGVDSESVRAAVAGSSALLSVEFDKTVASGFRWVYYELPDPEADAVLAALRASGYSDDDARSMVALCGTRLRLLADPLKRGAAQLSARAFTSEMTTTAVGNFADLHRSSPPVDRKALAAVLDAALAAEAGRAAPPRLGGRMTEQLAQKASKVLYVKRDRTLTFQSRLHADVWRRLGAGGKWARDQL